MSLRQRITRALHTLATVELDEQARFGARGEVYARQLLAGGQGICIHNPVIPHPTKPGVFLESDFLIFTRGKLFCVEIKHYKGRLSYATGQIQLARGPHHVSRNPRINDSAIIQEKAGNYGEGVFRKEHRNPLKQTRSFIHHLKQYLGRVDARCQQLFITPVVGFSDIADISAIYDFEAGMLYTWQLPAFFERAGKPATASPSPPWLRAALARVPTWDRILTTRNEWITGVITERALTFRESAGSRQSIPYHGVQSIHLHRTGLFSAYDQLTITGVDGYTRTYNCVSGEMRLRRPGGEYQTHKLRNVNQVLPGIANKLAPR